MPQSLLFLFVFLFSFPFSLPSFASHNVTVDDTSPLITYSGNWSTVDSTWDYAGSHHYTQQTTATATFTFTGTAIYYVAALWPYTVTTQLTLDSMAPTLVSMTDPNHTAAPNTAESEPYSVIWGRTGLSNTSHTIVAAMPSGGNYVVMDALIYTVDDGDTAQVPSATSTSASSSGHSSSSLGVIIGASVGGIALIAIIVLAFWLCRRQQRKLLILEDINENAGLGDSAQKHVTPFISQGQGQANGIAQQTYPDAQPFPQPHLNTGYASQPRPGLVSGYQPIPQRADSPMSSLSSQPTLAPASSMGSFGTGAYDPYASIGTAMMFNQPSTRLSHAGANVPTVTPHSMYPPAGPAMGDGSTYPQFTANVGGGHPTVTGYPPQTLSQSYQTQPYQPQPQQYQPQPQQYQPQPQQYQPQPQPPQPQQSQPQYQQPYPTQSVTDNAPSMYNSGASTSAPSEFSSVAPSSVAAEKRYMADQKQVGGPGHDARHDGEDDMPPPPAYTQM